ncbi:MAG: MtnX-like HAD-IB family phosphatase [candidate division Zixibacteria bacterium]|nr:MtnX-like HAD-IB family phosphatase [candidate division Zixibacteria bacterium]
MPKVSPAIFCDFDGTVTRRDVGYHIFKHFSGGRNDALLPDWKAGRLTTRDCLRMEAEMVHATPDEIFSFIDQFELDETFAPFVAACGTRNIPLTILSEGMDLYIKRLLTRSGLDHLTVHSNIGHMENGGLRIEFPYQARSCEGCGNCKATRIAEYRETVDSIAPIVFIGDGYSDACGARAADIVFAKKDLKQYCQDEAILYNDFGNFIDVIDRLRQQGLWTTPENL